MEIKGIGIDIVDIKKLEKILKGKAGKAFVKSTFTEHEIACAKGGINIYKLATSFAAKEAAFKAFGTGWIDGKLVEVAHKRNGAPSLRLYGKMEKLAKKMKIRKSFVSLSYTERCAIASVVLSK